MDGAEKQHRLVKILILIFLHHFYGDRNKIVTAVDFTIKVKPGLQNGKGNSSESEIHQSEQMLDSGKNIYQTRQDYNEKIQLLKTPFSGRDKKDHEMIISPKFTENSNSNADDKLNDNDLDEINNQDKDTDEPWSLKVINTTLSRNNTASKQNTISGNKRKQKRCAKNKTKNSILKQKPIKLLGRVMDPVTPPCCQSLSKIYTENLNIQNQCKCSNSINTIQPSENELLGARINSNIIKIPNNQNNNEMKNFLEYNNQVKNMISDLKVREREYEAVMTDNDMQDNNNKFINQKLLSDRKLAENLLNNHQNIDGKNVFPHSFQGIEIFKKLTNDETANKEINWQEEKLLDELNSRVRGTSKDYNNAIVKLSDDMPSSIESTPIITDVNSIMEEKIPLQYDSKGESSNNKLQLNDVKTHQEPINNNGLPIINHVIVSEKKKEIIQVTTFKAILNDKINIFLKESNTKRIIEEESTRKGIMLLDEDTQGTKNDLDDSDEGIKPNLVERTNLNKPDDNTVSSIKQSSDKKNKLENDEKLNDEFSQNDLKKLEETNFQNNTNTSTKNTENDNGFIRSDEENSVYHHNKEKIPVQDNTELNQLAIYAKSITEKEDSNYINSITIKPTDLVFERILTNVDEYGPLISSTPLQLISANQINNKSNVDSNNISDKIMSKNQGETLENSSPVSSVEYTTIPLTISTAQNDYIGTRTNEITQGSKPPIYLTEVVESRISPTEQEHSTRDTENFKTMSQSLIASNEIPETKNFTIDSIKKNDEQELDRNSNEKTGTNSSETTFITTEINELQENITPESYSTKYNSELFNLTNLGGDKLTKTGINSVDKPLERDSIDSNTTENIINYRNPLISNGELNTNDSKEIEGLSNHQTTIAFHNTETPQLQEEKIFENSVETTSSSSNLNDIKFLSGKESQLQGINNESNYLSSSLNQLNGQLDKSDYSKENNTNRQYSSTLYPWSTESEIGLSTVILNTDEIAEHDSNIEDSLLAETGGKSIEDENSKIKLPKTRLTDHTEIYSVTETINDRSLPSNSYTYWEIKSTEHSTISDLKRTYPTTEISISHTETDSKENSKINDKTNENIASRTHHNESYSTSMKTTTEHNEPQSPDYEKQQIGGTFRDIEITSTSSQITIPTKIYTTNEENSSTTIVTHFKTSKHGSDTDNSTIKFKSKDEDNLEVNTENERKTNIAEMKPKELIGKGQEYSFYNHPSTGNYESNLQESVNKTVEGIDLGRKDSDISTEKYAVDVTQNTNDILEKGTFHRSTYESSSRGSLTTGDDSVHFTTPSSQITKNADHTTNINARNNTHDIDTLDINEELQVLTDGFKKESSYRNPLLELPNGESMQTTNPNYNSFKVNEYHNRLETTTNYNVATELTPYTSSLKDLNYMTAHSEANFVENNTKSQKLNPFVNDKEDSNISKTHTPKNIEFTHDTSVTADQLDIITDSKPTNNSTLSNISNVLYNTSKLNHSNYEDENDNFENLLHYIQNVRTSQVSKDSKNDTSEYRVFQIDENNNFITNSPTGYFTNGTTTESMGNRIFSENSADSAETEMKDKFSNETESNIALPQIFKSDENKLDSFSKHYGNFTSGELITIQLPSENPLYSTVAAMIKKVSEESENIFPVSRVLPSNANKTISLTEDYTNAGTSKESTGIWFSSKTSAISNEFATTDKYSEDIENNISLPRISPTDKNKLVNSSERYTQITSYEPTGIPLSSKNLFESPETKVFSKEFENNTSLLRVLPLDENKTNSMYYANGISNESVGIKPLSEKPSDLTENALTDKFPKELQNSTLPPWFMQSDEKTTLFTDTHTNKFLNEPIGIQTSSDNPLSSTIILTTRTLYEEPKDNIPSPIILSTDKHNNINKTNLFTKQYSNESLDIQIPYEDINNILDITGDYVPDEHSQTEKVPEVLEQRKVKENTYDNIYTAEEILDDTLNKLQETHSVSSSTISYFDNEDTNFELIHSKSNSSETEDDDFGYKHDEGKINGTNDFDKHFFIKKLTEKTGSTDKNELSSVQQKTVLHSLITTEVTTAIKIIESEVGSRNSNNDMNNTSENYMATRSYPTFSTNTEVNPKVEEILHPGRISDFHNLTEYTVEFTTEATKAIKSTESEIKLRTNNNDMTGTSENYTPTRSYPISSTNTEEVNPKVEKILHPERTKDFDNLTEYTAESTTEAIQAIKITEFEIKPRTSNNDITSTFENYIPTRSYPTSSTNTEVNPKVEEILHPGKILDFDNLKEKNESITDSTIEDSQAIKIKESEIKVTNSNNEINGTSENYMPTRSYPITSQNTEENTQVDEVLHPERISDFNNLKEKNESNTELSELNERIYTTNVTPLRTDFHNLTNNEYILKLDTSNKTITPTSPVLPLYLQEEMLYDKNNSNKLNLLQSPKVEFDETPSNNIPLQSKGIIDDFKEGIPVILSLPVLIIIKNASLLESPQSKFFIENNGKKIEIDVKKSNRPSQISKTPYQTDLEDDNNQVKRLERQNMIDGSNEILNEKGLSKSRKYNDNKNRNTRINYDKVDPHNRNSIPFNTDEENTKEKKYPLLGKLLLSPQIKESINDKLKMMFDKKQYTKSKHDQITPDSNIIDVVYTSLKRLKKLFNDN